MRLQFSILALCGLLLSAPAGADITIRYAPDSPGGLGLLIEADGQGRIRAEIAPGQLLIMRGADIFVVTPGEEGPTVSRLDDFLVIATEAARAFEQSHPNLGPPLNMHFRLSERGPATVGTWPGRRVAMEQIGSNHPEQDVEWVVSRDPALAEAGRVATWFFETQGRIQATIIRFDRAEFMTLLRQLTDSGTPLRVTGQYHLASLSSEPVPASRFDLPGPVLSREQLRARQPH